MNNANFFQNFMIGCSNQNLNSLPFTIQNNCNETLLENDLIRKNNNTSVLLSKLADEEFLDEFQTNY
jgi:hypothetical protein